MSDYSSNVPSSQQAQEAIDDIRTVKIPKYKVNDLVSCNQGPGHIIGMQPCKTYRGTATVGPHWEKKFPGFFDEYVYMVLFDVPQKNLTFDEFVEARPDIKEEYLRDDYEEMPVVPCVMCPEQEIQLEWEA